MALSTGVVAGGKRLSDSVTLPIHRLERLLYSYSLRERAAAIQARSKTALSANQNIAVNCVPSNGIGITSTAVIIPITAHSPPRIPKTQATIAIIDLPVGIRLALF